MVMLDNVLSVHGVLLLKQATGRLGGAFGYFLQTSDDITVVLPPELAGQKQFGNLYELTVPPNVSIDRSELGRKVTLVGTFENGHGFYTTPIIFMVNEVKSRN